MHRGFNFYYCEGLITSGRTVYRNKCFFRFILYFLAEFFGRILVLFNPHFNIANMRQGYIIRKANKLDFSSSFRNVGHRASLGTYLLTLCFEGLIIIAGIAVIAVLAAMFGSIGYAVSVIANYHKYELFVLLFAAPFVPVVILYVLISLLIFSPTAYIIANNEGVSAGETIGACYRSMINNGKMTVFLSYFISGLLKSLYWGAVGTGGYFLFTRVIPENYFKISLVGLIIVSLLGYMTFAPILTLTNRVVKEHLFEDIVLDPATAARINEKVNISVCNGKKITPELTSQNLASLFEYTEDPYRILDRTEQKSQFLINPPKATNKKNAINTVSVKPDASLQNKLTEKASMAEPQPATERFQINVKPQSVEEAVSVKGQSETASAVNSQPAAAPVSQLLS